MGASIVALTIAVLLALSASAFAQGVVARPNAAALFEMARISEEKPVYSQDFEDESTVVPMQLWYEAPSANKGRVVSQGLDKSIGYGSSKASYRVEVLFESQRPQEFGAIYVRFPVSIPIWSDMTLQWRIKTESEPNTSLGGRHGLATGWAGGTDGNTASGYGRKVEGPDNDGWELWQASVVSSQVNPAEYISSITLYIEVPGPVRGVIHLDDIKIVGRLQSGWENEWKKTWEYYTVYAEKEQRSGAERRLVNIRAWNDALRQRQAALRFPVDASSILQDQFEGAAGKVTAALAAAKPLTEAVEAGLKSSGPFTADVHAAELKLMDARFWLDVAESCAPYGNEQQVASVVTYTLDPTRSHQVLPLGPKAHIEQGYTGWNPVAGYYSDPAVLPQVKPVPARAGTRLANFGAPGTYVPFSFAVEAGRKLENLSFTIGDLFSRKTKLKTRPDLRVVAPVYMPAGKEPKLMNAMLVHDPDFVRAVGKAEGYNRFKDAHTPDDAATMQPITIEAGQTRQFYLLIKLPTDAKPGTYVSRITGRAADGTKVGLDLKLDVLPFKLEPTPFAYSAFCDSGLADPETVRQRGFGGGDDRRMYKTFEQLEQDFISQAEHGFNTLHLRNGHVRKSSGETGYSPLKAGESWDFRDFDRMLDAAVKAGLTRSPFTWISGPPTRVGPPERKDLPHTQEEMVAWINGFVPAIMAHCKEKGYPSPAFFGADEVTGERLKAMKPGYEAVRKAGGLVIIACYSDFLGILGPDTVLPILGGGITDENTEQIVRAVQAKGMPVWIYNCPATNVYDAPSSMRRRYGLAMWRNGENGEATWAYDDMRVKGGYAGLATDDYGTFCLAFPTWSGKPIDTLTYESMREGIYDTRYMATLEKALAAARKSGKSPSLVKEIDAWMKSFSVHEDLQNVRRKMVDYITRLQRAAK